MDLQLLAANIKRLRTTKKLSQKELAEKAGLSLPAIKKIESGSNPPRVSTLQDIAQALTVKLQELFVPVPTLSSVRFRAKKKVQGREQILTDVTRWLNDFAFLEETLGEKQRFRLADIVLRAGSVSVSPEAIALQAREILGLKPQEPIYDICGLIEHAGIKVLPYEYASDSFFGLSIGEADNGPAIIVNNWDRLSTERQIFSAAHELGHLLMHLGGFSTAEETENDIEEREADLFAGHFLMPEAGFKLEWQDTAGLHFVDRVMKVKRIFRVSYKTVLRRLLDMKVVDEKIWMKFQMVYQRRFNKKLTFKEEPFSEGAEPFGMQKFDFFEDRLSRLVKKAVDTDAISMSRGAEILNVSIEEAQELLSDWEVVA